MTIADLLLFSDSRRFFCLVLLINKRGRIFNCIPFDNLISRQSIFVFLLSRYCTSDIPCIFNVCQRSRVSILIILSSTNLAALISIFEWKLIIFSRLDFSVSKVEMAPDCEYPTLQNWIKAGIPTICSDLLKANIKSASEF